MNKSNININNNINNIHLPPAWHTGSDVGNTGLLTRLLIHPYSVITEFVIKVMKRIHDIVYKKLFD